MSLSVGHLEKIQESSKIKPAKKEILTIILSAINDWPTPIASLVNFEEEIYKLIGERIEKKSMVDYISKIDYSKKAWQAESLSQLIEVYNYYEENKLLKEIFNEIEENVEEL